MVNSQEEYAFVHNRRLHFVVGTPLTAAAQNGQWPTVLFLLDQNANPLVEDSDHSTILHWASRDGKTELLSRYGQKIAINQRGLMGYTPLHWAAQYAQNDAIRILLKKGADVNAETDWGATPIHLAAAGNKFETLRLLSSCDEYDPQEDDWLVQSAILGGNPAMIEETMKWGAPVSIHAVQQVLDPGLNKSVPPKICATVIGAMDRKVACAKMPRLQVSPLLLVLLSGKYRSDALRILSQIQLSNQKLKDKAVLRFADTCEDEDIRQAILQAAQDG